MSPPTFYLANLSATRNPSQCSYTHHRHEMKNLKSLSEDKRSRREDVMGIGMDRHESAEIIAWTFRLTRLAHSQRFSPSPPLFIFGPFFCVAAFYYCVIILSRQTIFLVACSSCQDGPIPTSLDLAVWSDSFCDGYSLLVSIIIIVRKS